MKNDELPGEGNRMASRRYRERTERFINSKVEEGAHNTVPHSDADAADLEQAEDIARAPAAEGDRLLRDEEEDKFELPR